MYKLGPIHQGILERGSKTASLSYLLWPSRVGPYSVVMGKHSGNFDTTNFPFSYITVENGKSTLTPAMNLITVGTRRDSMKWPLRDCRSSSAKNDLICFNLFNPYIIGKILGGKEKLKKLYESTPKERESVFVDGVYIIRLMLKTGMKYYELALKVYLGAELVKLIEGLGVESLLKEISEVHKINEKEGVGEWIDMSGLFVPVSSYNKLADEISSGAIKNIPEINSALVELYDNYPMFALNWLIEFMYKRLGKDIITIEDLINIISDWKVSSKKLNNMILNDASKEFDTNSQIGYGFINDEEIKRHDFDAVQGLFEENKFVNELKEETTQIEEKAYMIIENLRN
jgi:hypothetical protein